MNRSSTVIYVPVDASSDRWERVTASLRAAGFKRHPPGADAIHAHPGPARDADSDQPGGGLTMARKAPLQMDLGLIIMDPEKHRQEMKRMGRKCLACTRTFSSTGPENRVCSPCKELEAWSSPADYSLHAAF
jgi:hypothetical protein